MDEAHCHHAEKEWMKQMEMMRKEELWGKTRGEAGEEGLGCRGATTAPKRTQLAIDSPWVVRPTCAPSAGSTRLLVW